jgi:hypothetical protein
VLRRRRFQGQGIRLPLNNLLPYTEVDHWFLKLMMMMMIVFYGRGSPPRHATHRPLLGQRPPGGRPWVSLTSC